MPDAATLQERKRHVREVTLDRRGRMTPAHHQRASQRIRERTLELPTIREAKAVFVFVSFGSEVDTHPLIDALLADGKSVAVPRIVDDTTIRAVTVRGLDDLEEGRWGILAPRDDAPTAEPPEAAIVPGVAFTERRDRLGHGRGYYDRWLADNAGAVTIALGFELQIVPEIPVEAHDRPVDYLVTEERVLGKR